MSKAKQPTLRQLNYLCALHQHLHFNKAAEHCSVSQAAFSIAVNNLEEALGVDLIDRTNKQVVFTLLGKKVADQASLILQQVEILKEIANDNATIFTSHLRLGVIPTIAPFILPAVIPSIKEKYPEMSVSIHEDLTANLHRALLSGDLDLLLLALPLELRGTETMTLFKDHFKVAYNKDSKFLFSNKYEEERLPDGSILLLRDGHCLRNHALSACDVKHADKISPYAVSSIHTLIQMVQGDLGITFIPEMATRSKMLAHTTIQTLDMPENAYREIGIAWRKGSKQADEFCELAEIFALLADVDLNKLA